MEKSPTSSTRNTNILRLHIPSSYVKNTGPVDFFDPQKLCYKNSRLERKACLSPKSLSLGVLRPQKVVAVGQQDFSRQQYLYEWTNQDFMESRNFPTNGFGNGGACLVPQLTPGIPKGMISG